MVKNGETETRTEIETESEVTGIGPVIATGIGIEIATILETTAQEVREGTGIITRVAGTSKKGKDYSAVKRLSVGSCSSLKYVTIHSLNT